MDNLGSFPCLILFVQFLVSYRRLLASICKENANERKENLFSICRVQLFFCKVTTFPRNFQVFWEKYSEGGKEKNRRLRNGESPVEYCCFDDETKDYLFFADFLNLLYHFVIGLLHLSVYPPCCNYTNEGSCATTI